MLVSHMSGLGDVASSLAHRKNKTTAAHVSTAAQRPAAAMAQAKQSAILAAFNPATDLTLHGRHRTDQIARKTAAFLGAKFASVTPNVSPSGRVLTKAGAIIPGPGTTSPLAMFLNKAATAATASPAAAAAAAAAPVPLTPAVAAALTATPAITPTGGGGGGGGGDTSPTDTTDMSTDAPPTGWAALSTTAKVAIVGGGAVVAYIGYRAMRRR